jgi:hypothetical protein
VPRLTATQREAKEREAQILAQMKKPDLPAAVYADLGKQLDRIRYRQSRKRLQEKREREKEETLGGRPKREFLAFHFVCELFTRFRAGDENIRQCGPWYWLRVPEVVDPLDEEVRKWPAEIEAAETFTTGELMQHLRSAHELLELGKNYPNDPPTTVEGWDAIKREQEADYKRFEQWFSERFD